MASTIINSIFLGPIWLQSGTGTPDHMATKGTMYIDLDTAIEYLNNDGFISWTEQLSVYNTSGITSGFTAELNSKYDKSGGTISGNTNILGSLTASTISATTYQNLPLDIRVTGGTFNNNTDTLTFTNNSGGTFNITGVTDSYTTGATLSGNTIIYGNNTFGPNFYSVNLSPVLGLKYDKSGGTVSGTVTANSFVKSGGTSSQFLKADGSVDITLYEDSTNKQNSMVYDGTGIKFPTVDGVNIQANNLLKVASGTGFIDYDDTFNMVLTDPNTITVTGSDPGTFVKSRLFLPPFVPIDAIKNITSRLILPSSIPLPPNGRFFRFLGYDYNTDSIIASSSGFFLVNDIVALGVVEMLASGGTNTFTAFQMQLDVSTVSLFDLTMSPNQTTSKIYPNTDLTTNISSGLIKSCGISWGAANPHVKIVPPSSTLSFIRIDPDYLTTSTGYPTITSVDTTTYWNGSALVSTGNNNSASIQRWLLHIDGRVFLQAAEQTFPNFTSAQAVAQTVAFTDIIPTELVIEIARMVAVKNTSNLANTTQAQFYYTIAGGGSVAGGSTSFATIGGSPYDNLLLGAELNSKFNVTGGTISGNTNILGSLTANTFIKSGGTSNQFLKADGSVDLNGYVNTATTLNINGVTQNLSTNREWRTAQADTGVLVFSGLTTASTSTINIGAIKGYIIDNETNPLIPTNLYLDYSGQTGVTVTTRLTGTESFVFLTSGGTISFQNTFPTSADRKTKIWLGKISHPNTLITLVINEPDYITSPLALTRDFYQKITYINENVYPYANGANLNINITTGKIGGNGINFVNSRTNPNELSMGPGVAQTFTYRTQTGGTTSGVTLISPSFYDVGGVITPVGGGSNTSTIQYIFAIPGLGYIIQYGQNTYANLPAAIAGVGRETFTLYPNLVRNAILIGVIALTKNATDLSNLTQAQFFKADMFGQIIGATAGVTVGTMQTAYNNSLVPQVTVNDSLGAMTWRNGRALDASNVVEWQNITGTTTASVNGNGVFSGTSFVKSGGTSSQILMADGSTFDFLTNQIEVSGNNTTQLAWNGKEVTFMTSGLHTIPNTLMPQFSVDIACDAGVTMTWAITAPFTWRVAGLAVGVAPPTMTEGQFCTVSRRLGTNEIRVRGL